MRLGRVLATAATLVSLLSGAGCQAEPWGLWQAYCSSFIDGQGRVIDHQNGDRTTSEGQAYAMLFALIANDRARFDHLLAWTRENLAQGDLTTHRPGWEWGRAQVGQWKLLDANSAADADLWMCYALSEAGRLWNEPRYAALGRVMASRIAQEEVANLPGFGPMLLPGSSGFHPAPDTWLLNPSYLPLPVIERLAEIDPGGPWGAMARELPQFLAASAPHGFAMDWVSYSPGKGFVPAAVTGKDGKAQGSAAGSFDAIRVYLWAGMSSANDPRSRAALAAVGGMGQWLQSHLFPPERVSAEGTPGSLEAPVGFSAAVIPYLHARGETSALSKQQDRLQAQLDSETKLYGHPPAYYDQNLALFGEGWETHRFRFDRDGKLRVQWKKS